MQLSVLNSLLLYCRAGFESECSQEISAIANNEHVPGYVRTKENNGFVEYVAHDSYSVTKLLQTTPWRKLIFARQVLNAFAELKELNTQDRLTPILACLTSREQRYNEVWVESSDTNSGKELSTFCRKFSAALVSGLKRNQLLDKCEQLRLHVFFPQSNHAILSQGDIKQSSPWPQGILRLKFPHEAPSRSTLKLEEAFQVLLNENERQHWLNPGMTAVDLGAAPGGWTWQFVQRSIHVTAVDNGALARNLMDSGLVNHVRTDGFTYQPKHPVDWLVCDMVEQPRRVANLIAFWLSEQRCKRAIFNLKLPMKKRFEEVALSLEIIRESARKKGKKLELRAKQLYHDREEITVFVKQL